MISVLWIASGLTICGEKYGGAFAFPHLRMKTGSTNNWDVAFSAVLRRNAVSLPVEISAIQEDAPRAAPISVTSHVDKSRITIGDLIEYTVTVEHDDELQVEMPGLGENLGGFEIRDYEVMDPRTSRGRITRSVRYTISTFLTGEFVIPPLAVTYFTEQDSSGKTLNTEKIKIIVESVKPSEAGDIRDIKPPLEIPADPWLTLRWIVLGVLVCGIVLGAVWTYRRKKAGKGLLPDREEPTRPPHEVALEGLDRLRDAGPVRDVMAYYIDISEIIRQYIGGRYFLVAMEMTTSDVLEGLHEEDIPEDHYRMFEDFLQRCDLVKFAKAIPSETENGGVLKLAYEIVEATKVILETVEPESGDAEKMDAESEARAEGVDAATRPAAKKPAVNEQTTQEPDHLEPTRIVSAGNGSTDDETAVSTETEPSAGSGTEKGE